MKSRKAALAFILITVVLDMIALGGAPWYVAAVMLFVAMAMAFTVEQPQMARGSGLASSTED